MTLPGSLPEPRRQDHKFRGHLLPKEVVSSLPGLCPKEIPREACDYMAKVLILFPELSGWAKGGVGWHCIGRKFERGQGE